MRINAYIMALFIFQFGFLQPIASIVNSQWPIAVFTLSLLIFSVLKNGFKMKRYVLYTFVILTIYFFLNALVYQESSLIILAIYLGFVSKGFAGLILGSLDTDWKNLNNAFIKVAIFNFCMVAPFPFMNFLDSMNYMRFGYALIPSVLIFYMLALNKGKYKWFWTLLFATSFLLMSLYGSRGTFIAVLIFVLIVLVFNKKISVIKKVSTLVIIGLIVYIIGKFNFISRVVDFLYFDMGIKSYSLAKLRLTLDTSLLEASSGRDGIYSSLMTLISKNPVYGYGIGYAQKTLDFTAHNIFLQVLLESGIVGLIIWSLIWVYCIKKVIAINNNFKVEYFRLVALLIALALGRLLVSSDVWLRPEYWFTISLLINFKSEKYK
ncbi:O-antigen ligase [Sporosarcina sp. P7]|uniref:O-antigen ligase family protein n=1 Tax=Sporosarcina sp. P7 TaxID=2048244 RepID=UPI000C172E04|nr:O-antigen ligase family protein [Sporosarcina sp. P7]PID23863.1 hypothetical protein CSV60_12435 [Sporosarcina sp. P7]